MSNTRTRVCSHTDCINIECESAYLWPRTQCAWNEFFESLQPWLKESETDLSVSSEIKRRLVQLHQRLAYRSEDYRQALALAGDPGESKNSRWLWQLLMDSDDIRSGLLTIHQNKPVPLHDHPGSNGLLMVLSGRVYMRQFDAPVPKSDTTLVELQGGLESELETGGVAAFRSQRGNVHTLVARTSRCVLLQVVMPPYQETRRSWYFPVTEHVQRGKLFAQQVRFMNTVSTARMD